MNFAKLKINLSLLALGLASSNLMAANVVVQPGRSLLINEIAVLEAGGNFSLRKTLDQLAGQIALPGPATSPDGVDLFRNLWSLQVSSDQQTIGSPEERNCSTTINGWPHLCNRTFLEGRQIVDPQSHLEAYKPLALVNRFDQRDGAPEFNICGEYRIIYGRESATAGALERNFIIFEGVLANPTPGNLNGCRPIQQFWANLSSVEDPVARSNALEQFFYQGIPLPGSGGSSDPVISARHFALQADIPGGTGGQIRTNQFLNNFDLAALLNGTNPNGVALGPWVMKQFRLINGGLMVKQEPVADTPPATLFDESNQSAIAVQYRNQFLGVNGQGLAVNDEGETIPLHLTNLLKENLNDFRLTVSNPAVSELGQDAIKFDFAESFSLNSADFIDFEHSQLETAATVPGPTGQTFIDRVNARLAEMGRLSPDGLRCPNTTGFVIRNANGDLCYSGEQIVRRATAAGCAGCHNPIAFGLVLPGVGPLQVFPSPASGLFVHVSAEVNDVEAPTHYVISSALTNIFLPHRKQKMEQFLNSQ